MMDDNGHCSLSMGRYSSNITGEDGERDGVSIRITDEDSRCVVFEMRLSCADMLRAMTGLVLSDRPCFYGALEKVGLKHENKTEVVKGLGKVFWGRDRKEFVEAAQPLLKPYLVDGWQVSHLDANANRVVGHDDYSVNFVRWVPKENPKQ